LNESGKSDKAINSDDYDLSDDHDFLTHLFFVMSISANQWQPFSSGSTLSRLLLPISPTPQ